jgi:D-alanyl-lipoteichoic acid acyltransferase DltB (MBOAT superfamily)
LTDKLTESLSLHGFLFWIIAAAAVFLLVPLTRGAARRLAFAAINLTFLAFALGLAFPWILLLVGTAWLLLHFLAGSWRSVILPFAALVVLGLFVFHKLPELAPLFSPALRQVLVVVGFSYVALRFVDAARAVYEGLAPPTGIASTINYLLPFHMLAAGPIQSYMEFVSQPDVPAPLRASEAMDAYWLISWGLFKKYVLATLIEQLLLTGFRAGWAYSIFELQMNFIWLYLDFSAYSEVALGVGRLIGFATPLNFNRPYLARNIIEFWERWHISLSMFIRRNIFFPLQLALVRRFPNTPLINASIAFLVSFALCGVWHEISLRMFYWGLLQAFGLITVNIYRHYLQKKLGRSGLKRYMANRWIRAVGIFITFEFEAFAVMIQTLPKETYW